MPLQMCAVILLLTGCSFTLESDSGKISSPGFPNQNYANFVECSWTINTASDRGITLHFDDTQFSVDPSDTIQVRNLDVWRNVLFKVTFLAI